MTKIALGFIANQLAIPSMFGVKNSLAKQQWKEGDAILVKITLGDFNKKALEAHNNTSLPINERYWLDKKNSS